MAEFKGTIGRTLADSEPHFDEVLESLRERHQLPEHRAYSVHRVARLVVSIPASKLHVGRQAPACAWRGRQWHQLRWVQGGVFAQV